MEIRSASPPPRAPQCAVFDFDGTVSLIREGWQDVMIPMMVHELTALESGETHQALHDIVREFVMELTGKPSIYQMIRFTEEMRHRGANPLPAEHYLARFQTELSQIIDARKSELRDATAAPEKHLVPGVLQMLDQLRARDVVLVLVSGTDRSFVREEVALLDLVGYFDDRVFGPTEDDPDFTKDRVIREALTRHGADSSELVGFGDGVVETKSVKDCGGYAVGIAGDEKRRDGRIDAWKRERLVRTRADMIVADFQQSSEIVKWLFSEQTKS